MGVHVGSRLVTLALGLMPSLCLAAPVFEDLRTWAGPGWDIAQYKIAHARDPRTAQAAVRDNWAVRDINGDGLADVLAIFEVDPRLEDERGRPCPAESYETGCYYVYGARALRVYLGHPSGGVSLVSVNNTVLQADEGGVFGDPLEGLSFNERGSLVLGFYGGSSWRWWNRYTFQWRAADLHLIGKTEGSMWNVTGELNEIDENYLTHRRKTTTAESFEAPSHEEWSTIPAAPLKAFGDVRFGEN